jgi:hypothetical protein
VFWFVLVSFGFGTPRSPWTVVKRGDMVYSLSANTGLSHRLTRMQFLLHHLESSDDSLVLLPVKQAIPTGGHDTYSTWREFFPCILQCGISTREAAAVFEENPFCREGCICILLFLKC